MYVVFLGTPGAGKGTQAVALAERFGWAHVATGDLLREAVHEDTELGKAAKDYMERGELVPDSLVVAMIVERLSRADAEKGAVMDGFPRNIEQAKELDRELEQRGEVVDLAIYLKVPIPVVVGRLAGRWNCRKCGNNFQLSSRPPKTAGVCDRCGSPLYQRPDDRPETVRRRLEVYLEQTEPVLQFYAEQGVLVEVNGEQSIPQVGEDIAAAVLAAGAVAPGT